MADGKRTSSPIGSYYADQYSREGMRPTEDEALRMVGYDRGCLEREREGELRGNSALAVGFLPFIDGEVA